MPFHLPLPLTLVNFGQGTVRREIVGRRGEHHGQLRTRVVQASELAQRAAERDARGEIAWMVCESGDADRDRFIGLAGAAALFGELGKSNRRRIHLDPASKLQQPWIIRGHVLNTTARP